MNYCLFITLPDDFLDLWGSGGGKCHFSYFEYKRVASVSHLFYNRRNLLEKKLADADVSEEDQSNLLKFLEKKETEYMRLQRHKMGADDFELLTMIGKGAFGEVKITTNILFILVFLYLLWFILYDQFLNIWLVFGPQLDQLHICLISVSVSVSRLCLVIMLFTLQKEKYIYVLPLLS